MRTAAPRALRLLCLCGLWIALTHSPVTAHHSPASFAYDGARRVQEVTHFPDGTEQASSGGGSGEAVQLRFNDVVFVEEVGGETVVKSFEVDPNLTVAEVDQVLAVESNPADLVEALAAGGAQQAVVKVKKATTDREYVYGPDFVDEYILQIAPDLTPQYILQDANHNVVAVLDEFGNPLAQYTYAPFGGVIIREAFAPHAEVRMGHQGLFFDRLDAGSDAPALHPDAFGFYQNRNRTYSPDLGRFLQRDPNETAQLLVGAYAMNGNPVAALAISFSLEALYGDGMNLFAYLGNNPINRTDPAGLAAFDYFAAVDAFTEDLEDVRNENARQAVLARVGLAKGASLAELYRHASDLWGDFVWDLNEDVLYDLVLGGLFARACFPAETQVLMADGRLVPIEEVRPGDKVACDIDPELDNGGESCVVRETYSRLFSSALVSLEFEFEGVKAQIDATPEHLFYVSESLGYVAAVKLSSGTSLRTHSSSLACVRTSTRGDVVDRVYNLEVEGAHNYFVTRAAILVHNGCPKLSGPTRKPLNLARGHGGEAHLGIGMQEAKRLEKMYGNSVRWNQALIGPKGGKISSLRPDIQYIKNGKVYIVEIVASNPRPRGQEEFMKLLGDDFGGYRRIDVP